jgi:hypothetical protein
MAGAHRAARDSSVWISLREHIEALHVEREKFGIERDRRYTEVSIEREKALKIKEVADLAALQLAREIQTYKDEKANELREQINSERGLYATKGDLQGAIEKVEATVKPLVDYVSAQQGRSSGIGQGYQILIGLVLLAIALYGALH